MDNRITGTSSERFALTPDADWPHWPNSHPHRDVAGVATDAERNVYLFTRREGQVLVFTVDGIFIRAFGLGLFTMPHAITVDAEGFVFCVDCGDSTVRKFSPAGELLMTLGTAHQGSDTGWIPRDAVQIKIHDVESVRYAGPPFNGCTDIAIGPGGDLFVSDGYRNCRIHRFNASGELLLSWGAVGSGIGEFRLPHALVVHEDRVLVADRENDRIQVFDLDGGPIAVWEGLQRPTDLVVHPDGRIFVTELWRPPGNRGFTNDGSDGDRPSRMTVLSADGELIGRRGGEAPAGTPGELIAPHALAIDADGRIYVGEVTSTFAIERGLVGAQFADHQVQRFLPTDER